MSEEIFDIVDDSDVVVGRASRDEVHRSGHRHRSTHLLVFDSGGRVLLQKRSIQKDTFPGRWDSSVSGHVDSGESYDQCVVREASEEIGIDLFETPERLFKIDACEETAQEFTWVYRTFHDGPFQVNEDEISEIGWFAGKDLSRLLNNKREEFSPAFALVWAMTRDGGFLESWTN
ncbi:MAG: NUDIX domain-containing protein [Candidatus Poseidoniales archaeon]|nr:MAG: NUDIX domain-containing protein [Candidatus Poseidoniales archaeon]|tara:strand:- start:293 stop:817 length:525 start_codon:yes stop_codon:yes gene_type:complete